MENKTNIITLRPRIGERKIARGLSKLATLLGIIANPNNARIKTIARERLKANNQNSLELR
jgi:hypothetical protein